MKAKSSTRAAFFNLRALVGLTLCLFGLALAIPALRPAAEQPPRHMPVPRAKPREDLTQLEQYWHNRLTYPTGRFDPAWVRAAAVQHARMPVGVPAGVPALLNPQSPLALSTTSFTALGPRPERMTGCSQCENNSWGTAAGRVNDIAVDPTTSVNGRIVAYLGTSGGGVWSLFCPESDISILFWPVRRQHLGKNPTNRVHGPNEKEISHRRVSWQSL